MVNTENELYHENEDYIFYTNQFTTSATNYARVEDVYGRKLDKYMVLLCERKSDNDKQYVLINSKGTVVFESQSYEKIGFEIDKLKVIYGIGE